MKLLEVVRGSNTNEATIQTCMELGKKIDKISVLAGNCFGWLN